MMQKLGGLIPASRMANMTVLKLEHTQDDRLLKERSRLMRRLRLQSLLTDAANFKSKYSDEINQPIDFWLNRLRDTKTDHWIAYDDDTTTEEQSNTEGFGRWAAFLVVFSMGKQPVERDDDVRSSLEHDLCEHYSMAALYVDPVFRGRGVSTALLSAAIQDIREKSQGPKVVITLGVREHNTAAIRIYQRLGFAKAGQEIEEQSGGETDIMDLMRLELVPDPISESLK